MSGSHRCWNLSRPTDYKERKREEKEGHGQAVSNQTGNRLTNQFYLMIFSCSGFTRTLQADLSDGASESNWSFWHVLAFVSSGFSCLYPIDSLLPADCQEEQITKLTAQLPLVMSKRGIAWPPSDSPHCCMNGWLLEGGLWMQVLLQYKNNLLTEVRKVEMWIRLGHLAAGLL